MKKIIAIALAAGACVMAASSASAAEGCGPGGHRGPAGHCRANGRPVPPRLVIGNFYNGHGYWDGHRYRQHRERYRDGWRYR